MKVCNSLEYCKIIWKIVYKTLETDKYSEKERKTEIGFVIFNHAKDKYSAYNKNINNFR